MRSIRNTAVAGATIVALTLGATTAATAQTTTEETQSSVSSSQSDASLSSDANTGLDLEGNEPANGRDVFGSSKDLESQPAWAQVLYALSLIGGIGATVGLVVGPIYNFIVHGQ